MSEFMLKDKHYGQWPGHRPQGGKVVGSYLSTDCNRERIVLIKAQSLGIRSHRPRWRSGYVIG